VVAAARERNVTTRNCTRIREFPGQGLEGVCQGHSVRIGNREWCGGDIREPDDTSETASQLWIKIDGQKPVVLTFADQLREDAKAVIAGWKQENLKITLLSGDRPLSVEAVARALGVDNFIAEASPAGKIDVIKNIETSGHRVLMIGDGFNDAPALAAAYTSMAPAGASDIGRSAADIIFLGNHLAPAAFARRISLQAHRLLQQNFALAIAYNLIAIPVAMAGLASPLIAAVAMSTSSIIVTVNALRLRLNVAGG